MDLHSRPPGDLLQITKYPSLLMPSQFAGSAFLSINDTVIFPSNTSLLDSWQREGHPLRQTAYWNNLMKHEVD